MKKQKRNRYGFTMIELMAVLIIISLLAAIAVGRFAGVVDKARVKTTKANLQLLHRAVLQFKMDTGRYPTEEQGLIELIEQPTDVENWEPGGYIESTDLPKDGWGRDFLYLLNPESGKPFVIISYGADGQPEGEDYDTDLYSTDAS